MKKLSIKKTKFYTKALLVMDNISSHFGDKCVIAGGCIKIKSLDTDDEFDKANNEIRGIIHKEFGKKPSKVCKINYFNSNLYLCFKKKIKI